MKKILYIGEESSSLFVRTLSNKRAYNCEIRKPSSTIKGLANDLIADDSDASAIIINVENYINDSNEIVQEIVDIKGVKNVPIVVYCRGYSKDSNLVKKLIEADIKNLIFAGFDDELIEQLEGCLNGKFEKLGRTEIIEIQENLKKAEIKVQNIKSIGVAGTQRRVGTTSQAVQIALYLNHKGYKAAYVEANNNLYLDLSSGRKKSLSFVDKYSKIEDLNLPMMKISDKASIADDYDFYIYDYGSLEDNMIDKTAFLKDNIKFIVSCGELTEIDYLIDLLEKPAYSDCATIFNFIANDDKDGLLQLCQEIRCPGANNKERVYAFTDYTPDMFTLNNLDMYENLIPVVNLKSELPEKKKGFFGRKKK